MIRNRRSPVFVCIGPAITLQIWLVTGTTGVFIWLILSWLAIWAHLIAIIAKRIRIAALDFVFIIFCAWIILWAYIACFWLVVFIIIVVIVVAVKITGYLNSTCWLAVRVRSWKIWFKGGIDVIFSLNDRSVRWVFIGSTSSAHYIFFLNFRRLYSTWFIDDICAFRDVSLSYIRSILSTAIPAFYIVIVVWRRRWR